MINIILFQPEIPQNTGNIGRLCAFSNCRLHLIHPLGFEINDKNLRRAGMDYWKSLEVYDHKDWDSFIQSKIRPNTIYLLSTHAEKPFWRLTSSQEMVFYLEMKVAVYLQRFTNGQLAIA